MKVNECIVKYSTDVQLYLQYNLTEFAALEAHGHDLGDCATPGCNSRSLGGRFVLNCSLGGNKCKIHEYDVAEMVKLLKNAGFEAEIREQRISSESNNRADCLLRAAHNCFFSPEWLERFS